MPARWRRHLIRRATPRGGLVLQPPVANSSRYPRPPPPPPPPLPRVQVAYASSRNRQWHIYTVMERKDARSLALKRVFVRCAAAYSQRPGPMRAQPCGSCSRQRQKGRCVAPCSAAHPWPVHARHHHSLYTHPWPAASPSCRRPLQRRDPPAGAPQPAGSHLLQQRRRSGICRDGGAGGVAAGQPDRAGPHRQWRG